MTLGAALREPSEAERVENGHPAVNGPGRFGQFELIEELGRGGAGVVFKARDIRLNRLVALKLIRDGRLSSELELARFRAEAEIAAALSHPNIVTVYEVGERRGRPFISMELLEGGTLHTEAGTAVPRADKTGGLRAAAAIVVKLARAVHYAHRRGVLHRDLKPGNVLLDDQGEPRIADFGLARQLENSRALTLSGSIMGTPGYLSPEQAAGDRELTTASDVYGLGAILYELLTGRAVFSGTSTVSTLMKVRHQEPENPRLINPAVDRELATICLKCLEKEPGRRYASAAELADDLDRWLQGKPIAARPVTTWERAVKWARRNPAMALLSLSLVIIFHLLLGGGWIALVHVNDARHLADRRLYEALIEKAKGLRTTGMMGQRIEGVEAIREAAVLAQSLRLAHTERDRLRNEALASLSLADLVVEQEWPTSRPDDPNQQTWFDAELRRYVSLEEGEIVIRRRADERIVARWQSETFAELRQTRIAFEFGSNDQFLLGMVGRVGEPIARFEIWEIETGKRRFTIPALNSQRRVLPVCDFRLASREVAYVNDRGQLTLLDLHNGSRRFLDLHVRSAYLLRYSPDGTSVLISEEDRLGRVLVVNLQTGTRHVLDHTHIVSTFEWSADGQRILTGCYDKKARIWDASTGALLVTFEGHRTQIRHAVFTGDAAMVASSGDDELLLWSALDGHEMVRARGLRALAFSRTGHRLAFDRLNPRTCGCLEVVGTDLQQDLRLFAPNIEITDLDFTPDGRLFASSGAAASGVEDPQSVHLWDASIPSLLARLPVSGAVAVRFTPDRRFLLTGSARSVQRWPLTFRESESAVEVVIGDPEELVRPRRAMGGHFSVNQDASRMAVVTDDDEVSVLNLRVPTERRIIEGIPNLPWRVGLSQDGRWLAIGCYSDWEYSLLWDLTTMKEAARIRAGRDSRNSVFDPSGNSILVGARAIYEVPSWKLKFELGSGVLFGRGTFSRDGYGALLADERSLVLCQAATGAELVRFPFLVHRKLGAAAFDSGTSILVTGSDEGLVRWWNLRKIRSRLASMGLDWESPAAPPPSAPAKPISVRLEFLQSAPIPPARAIPN